MDITVVKLWCRRLEKLCDDRWAAGKTCGLAITAEHWCDSFAHCIRRPCFVVAGRNERGNQPHEKEPSTSTARNGLVELRNFGQRSHFI